jgi:hypothetical protein
MVRYSSCHSRCRGATRAGNGGGGGGCWRMVRGHTRHGARPSAATAAPATRCTWPCRRACPSPPSTTRRRGGASAATASTCHERSPSKQTASQPSSQPASEGSRAPAEARWAYAPLLHRAGWLSPALRCARARAVSWSSRRAHGRDLRSAAARRQWRPTTLTGCRLGPLPGMLRLCMAFSVPRAGIRTALPRARGAERAEAWRAYGASARAGSMKDES